MVLFALLANVAYLLWPSVPKHMVITPHPATLREYESAPPILVKSQPDVGYNMMLVEADAKTEKPRVIRQVASSSNRSQAKPPKKAFQGKVNINTASLQQLQLLPGIGPKMAERIVAHRSQLGRFTSVEQLLDVPGIGPKKLEKLVAFCVLQ